MPGFGLGQEIVRTSRYERAGISGKGLDKIEVLREKYSIPSRFSIISPSFGDDIILTVYRTDLKEEDGTLIQSGNMPFLFKDDALTAYYMLFNKEPVIIGMHAYSFNVYDARYKIDYVKKGLVTTKMLAPDEAFLTQDGYMLKVWRSKRHE